MADKIRILAYTVNGQKLYGGKGTLTQVQQITKTENGVKVLAPAKINLSLLISGKRPDGYHELETIMAKINLYDELLIEKAQKPGIEVICTGDVWAPAGRENLVYHACERILQYSRREENLKVTLHKKIPAGGGLGSASSDAAGALIGVNELLGLGLGEGELIKLAGELGSDVAFFIGGPLAICRGRGEKIEKIHQKADFTAALLLPNVSCSTAKVYANYHHDTKRYELLKNEIDGLLRKNNIEIVTKMCANMLDVSCFDLFGELMELKDQVEALGFGPLCLSGSGSSMYYVFDRDERVKAEEYLNQIRQHTGCNGIIIANNQW